MQNEINSPINVVAVFKKNSVIPLFFKYQNRTYKIKNIDLAYPVREGNVDLMSFSVSDKFDNSYKLKFNQKTLAWILEEIWTS